MSQGRDPFRDSHPSAPLVMASALLARTRRMKICTNIFLLPARHPLEVAEEVNTLNELSDNRFILGSGIGYKVNEFENVGWDFKTRARRMEECLEIFRRALSGEPFSYSGQQSDLDEVQVVPPALPGPLTPLSTGGRPPSA